MQQGVDDQTRTGILPANMLLSVVVLTYNEHEVFAGAS